MAEKKQNEPTEQVKKRLAELCGQTVTKLFIKVFSPFHEEEKDIDMTPGLVFEKNPNTVIFISVNVGNPTCPFIKEEPLPSKFYPHTAYDHRMQAWTKGNEIGVLDYEYYDFTEKEEFRNIISNKIVNIQCIELMDDIYKEGDKVIGLNICFENDFIRSSQLADGETVETKLFNKHNNLKNLEYLGEMAFLNCSPKSQNTA